MLQLLGGAVSGITLRNSAWAQAHRTAGSVFLDAVSFSDKGGWVVDPQYIEQMGAPYLMAHGMGTPVKNAATEVTIPKGGLYQVWVRTRDWCPGDWQAPGRFKLVIDGKVNSTEFGTNAGWNWQKGSAMYLNAGKRRMELEDLTGFNGRCDAIFLTQDKAFTPPNKLDDLARWRNAIHKLDRHPSKELTYDLVITGGGLAGCAAAIAAAEQNLKVALIHNRPVLGGNSSGEIRVHAIGLSGKGSKIIDQIATEHPKTGGTMWHNGSPRALVDDERRHASMDKYENISQYLDWSVYEVQTSDKKIISVDARRNTSTERIRFKAANFIDSSGDAVVAFKAGAEFRYGRESKNEFGEGHKGGELWSPEKPDNWVMGTSLLWRVKMTERASDFPEVPWATAVSKGIASKGSAWFWEYSSDKLHQVDDAETIRDHMLRAAYGNFSQLKKSAANKNLAFEWLAFIGGKRESRRVMGDHILTMKNIRSCEKFPDTVVEEKRAIDLHYQRIRLGGKHKYDFLSEAIFVRAKKGAIYYVPFRCLYSKDFSNLMMAGRCLSCSHVALGGPRVMRTTAQMGIACGYAAALCLKHRTNPRGVYQKHITELRKLIGYEAG
jgi:hypothetical protein